MAVDGSLVCGVVPADTHEGVSTQRAALETHAEVAIEGRYAAEHAEHRLRDEDAACRNGECGSDVLANARKLSASVAGSQRRGPKLRRARRLSCRPPAPDLERSVGGARPNLASSPSLPGKTELEARQHPVVVISELGSAARFPRFLKVVVAVVEGGVPGFWSAVSKERCEVGVNVSRHASFILPLPGQCDALPG